MPAQVHDNWFVYFAECELQQIMGAKWRSVAPVSLLSNLPWCLAAPLASVIDSTNHMDTFWLLATKLISVNQTAGYRPRERPADRTMTRLSSLERPSRNCSSPSLSAMSNLTGVWKFRSDTRVCVVNLIKPLKLTAQIAYHWPIMADRERRSPVWFIHTIRVLYVWLCLMSYYDCDGHAVRTLITLIL